MNRPNRRPTASPTIVVQAPAADRKKAGKLPEWATATAVVTGVTIVAFGTSSFYVRGLESALGQPLSIYFSPADYLRITPRWAISTLGVAICVFVVLALYLGAARLVTLLAHWFDPDERIYKQTDKQIDIFVAAIKDRKAELVIVATKVLMGILFVAVALHFFLPPSKLRAFIGLIVYSGIELLFVSLATFLPTSIGLRLLVGTSIGLILYAYNLGNMYAPWDIKEARPTRVLFESEKDRIAAQDGQVIFDLDRYLLLLLGWPDATRVIAIPHEKIRSIETPAPSDTIPTWFELRPLQQKNTPAVASPTKTPSSTPAASPTPAETSPKQTETPHVSPSTVQWPTTTAEPQKK